MKKSDFRKNEYGMYVVKIDGINYEFEKYGAEDAVDTLLDLGGLVGGPIGRAIGLFMDKGKMDEQFDFDAIGVIFESLTKNMSGANKQISKGLIRKLSSENVLCDGKKIDFNVHYQDKLPHMFKVIKAAIEVQYGNFSDAFKEFMPRKPEPKEPTTPMIQNHG